MGLTAQDNAYAERINRTIKEEYLDYWKPKTINQLIKRIREAVNNYNNKRPHKNLGYMSPSQFEESLGNYSFFNKPSIVIFNDNSIP